MSIRRIFSDTPLGLASRAELAEEFTDRQDVPALVIFEDGRGGYRLRHSFAVDLTDADLMRALAEIIEAGETGKTSDA